MKKFIVLLSFVPTICFGQPILVNLTGGTTGQYLKKSSNSDCDYTWATIAGGGDLVSTNNLSDVANAGTARTNLGLAIGTNVQAFDADLSTYAGITPSANIQSLLGSADYSAARTNMGLAIGTNVQAWDADLTTWAGITPTTIGTNIVSLTNPSALGYIRANADNTVTHRSYANTKVDLGVDAVTNESKATMFTSPTFTGTPVVPSAITVGGNSITFPAVAATLLPNTTTSGVAASPTASGTVTVTHNLGRIPTNIDIKSISSFTSNAAATPVPFSEGTFNSTGNRCLYMVINGTTSQVSQTSTVFSIIMVTSAGNSISGVIGNVTSTGFDIVFTETGTHTAGNYLWKAQEP